MGLMTVVSRMPQIFRKGAGVFLPTGTVVHDDAVDFAGTFVNMVDINDKLEMYQFCDGFEGDAINANPALWVVSEAGAADVKVVGAPVDVGVRACVLISNDANWASINKVIAIPHTTKGVVEWRWRNRAADPTEAWMMLTGTGGTAPFLSFTDTGKIRYHDGGGWIDIKIGLAMDTYYKVTLKYDIITDLFDAYINDVLEKANCTFSTPNTDIDKLQYYSPGSVNQGDCYIDEVLWNVQEGSYESQSIDVGVGVVWGQITWDEVLDGATIVCKVKTSPDDIDWTEAWQTVNSGDYITGNQRYVKYRYEIINATNLTEIDNVNITYSV